MTVMHRARAFFLAPPPAQDKPDVSAPSRPGQPDVSAPSRPGQPDFSAPSRPGHPDSSAPSGPDHPDLSAPSRPGQPDLSAPSRPGHPDSSAPSRPGHPDLSGPSRPGHPEFSAPPNPGHPDLPAPSHPDLSATAFSGWLPPSGAAMGATRPAEPLLTEPGLVGAVTSAAVLGRRGQLEAVAASLALSLRRDAKAKAATVAIVGDLPPLPEGTTGRGAARRLAGRLEEQGYDARTRGRLVWVRLDPDDEHLTASVRRVTLVGAPAVLAVAAPRSAQIDEALHEQDLLVHVTAAPDGPLAQLATAGLDDLPVVTARPLGRGLARMRALAGTSPARALRHLLHEATR
jgi:hypothetical protein